MDFSETHCDYNECPGFDAAEPMIGLEDDRAMHRDCMSAQSDDDQRAFLANRY